MSRSSTSRGLQQARLMYSINEGDLDGIHEVLDSGVSVNYRDIDVRIALQVAACHGEEENIGFYCHKLLVFLVTKTEPHSLSPCHHCICIAASSASSRGAA
ncbi:hypothetical protein PIB30_079771 [Stylosanthes scabra]|uniref:Uncharacterized protein n=1 Tax=Stylosanthes scabra TaxID=79078 RepID=A0ABU6RR85_9FABA|nr:hypothetical protein [Stylosanthes scabra]